MNKKNGKKSTKRKMKNKKAAILEVKMLLKSGVIDILTFAIHWDNDLLFIFTQGFHWQQGMTDSQWQHG